MVPAEVGSVMVQVVRLSLLALGLSAVWSAIAWHQDDSGTPAWSRPATVSHAEHGDSVDQETALVRLADRLTPFRLDHAAPQVRYGEPSRAAPADGAVPKPRLSLRGLIAGETRQAVLEGIPGIDGQAVVKEGDTLAGLKVQRIGRMTVLISGLDTTWALKLEAPWK
jgi:hypothetical protein